MKYFLCPLFLIVSFLFGCESKKMLEPSKPEENKIQKFLKQGKSREYKLSQRLRFIDSAYILKGAFSIDTVTLEIVYNKSNIHYDLKQIDSSYYYDKVLLKKAYLKGNIFYKGKASQRLAYFYKTNGVYDSAYFYYNLSKNFFQNLKDSSQVGRRLMSMGLIEKNQNDFFGSKETITEALQFLENKKDKKYIASSYNVLATNHRKLANLSDATIYYLKAIKVTDSEKDKLIYKNNLAATYIDDRNFAKAIPLLNALAKDSLLLNNRKEYARVLDNLVYAEWLSGSSFTEKEFKAPLKIRKENNDKRGQIASYTHLGEFYSKINSAKASSYFDSVIQLSKDLKIPGAEKDALTFLMKLEPTNVNLRDRYVFLQDSLYVRETKVKTQFAKYKYDDKLKQESILRLEKENTEKELEASQQRNQKIIYLGGFLCISTVFGLSLFGFEQRTKRLKQKSKAEKLEAVQETEAELSRKLHDEHGGKLNRLMSLIQRDANKDLILDKTEELYNHTRDFSRTLNSVDTGLNFWNSLKATLEYSKPAKVEMTFDGGNELNWSLVGHQTKTILFKVLQELVINMTRHSKATQTVILFKDQNKELYIYYEDDGVGASKEALLRKNGLQNTEKRIQAIGGSITFDSEEGKGFRAEIRIPK